MDYKEVSEARDLPGMRLALVAGLPSPWSQAAKAIFSLKGIPYTPVIQRGNQENPELVAWTGYRNAPVAVYETERPRANWLEILLLAERLAPEPVLIPVDIHERIAMLGLSHEICGECGVAWYGRQLMMHGMVQALGDAAAQSPMLADYGYCQENVELAPQKVIEILDALSAWLGRDPSSPYFISGQLTALDIYWAYFSLLFDNLPHEQNPMPDMVRQMWAASGAIFDATGYRIDPALIRHRDFMFETHLTLPLDF